MLALLAGVFVVLLALAPRAGADIYWANESYLLDDEITPGIGRAHLDGSQVNPSFITGAGLPSGGIAVDGGHVYWTNWAEWTGFGPTAPPPMQSTIARANLDGTGVEPSFIASGYSGAVAVSASHVYWTGSPNSIGRANLDGSDVDPSFIADAGTNPGGVAVDAGHVYWTNPPASAFDPHAVPTEPGSIGRANLDGSDVDPSFIADAGTNPGGVAVDAGHIYGVEFNESEIARAKLDGTNVDHSFVSGVDADGLALDARHVYWTNFYARSIGRANLDGTVVDDRFPITDADGPLGVAVTTLPDTKLAGRARAATTQDQSGEGIVVRVKVKAKEQLTAKASGTVKVNPSYKLKSKKAQVAAGNTKTLKLKPKKEGQAKRIAAALKQGEKATAKLTVKLTDPAGNSETEKLSVRLKR
jgi:hypothetical protein